MSTNCTSCITNERTGLDLLCDACRKIEHLQCHHYEPDPEDFDECPATRADAKMESESACSYCQYGGLNEPA